MAEARRRTWRVRSVCALGAALAHASCGGGSPRVSSGTGGQGAAGRDGGHDDGGAIDVASAGGAAGACPAAGELAAEPPLQQIALDGGLPFGEFPRALAVAQCDFWGRCTGMAAYLVDQCVDATVNDGYWTGPFGVTITYTEPTAQLFQAVASGEVRYDAHQGSQCMAALLAQGCLDYVLVQEIPACADVFTCVTGTDAGDAGPSDGAADGGPPCSALLPFVPTVATCSSAADCADAGAGQVPYCVDGICTSMPCGFVNSTCVQAGAPCHDSTADEILHAAVPPTTGNCAPGLACTVRTLPSGALGTCFVPQDVGVACGVAADCKPGLACACGLCEIPPRTGPCAAGLCEIGVAYCDIQTSVCRPVRQLGADCSDAIDSCAPGLLCDITSTCQPLD
jgi:hypothetical protein